MKKQFGVELEEFLDSIDNDTPEKIILQISKEDLKNPVKSIVGNAQMKVILEGATLARTFSSKEGLMLILLKDSKIYGLDWMDGYGVTLCEYKQSKDTWSFQG